MIDVSERNAALFREAQKGYKPLKVLAAEFGVTRQRIHQLLTRHGIARPAKPPKYWCSLCGEPKLPRRAKGGRWSPAKPGKHRSCMPEGSRPLIACSTCGRVIEPRRGVRWQDIRSRIRRNRSGEFFCDRSCFGRYWGLYHGFGKGEQRLWPNLSHYEDVTPGEKDLVAAIHEAVPKYLTPHLREEVCQEAALMVLSGECCLEDLGTHIPTIIRSMARMYPAQYGPLSLDAAPPWNPYGRPLKDTI